MTAIILCGGSGTRLWPISRTLLPKQFVQIFGGQSLFQKTIQRNADFCEKIVIVTGNDHYFLAADQLADIGRTNDKFLLEPIGRNTAAAIVLAALTLDPQEVVLVLPSDHLINDEKAYRQVVQQAEKYANDGYLTTFGIAPSVPETGYGYIEADNEKVISFKEKPDTATAEEFLRRGNFYWNSGMFCFKVGVLLSAFERYSHDIFAASKTALQNAKIDHSVTRIVHNDMLQIPEISIDYAIMEKADNVRVVRSAIGWSDMGSFESLYDELPKDASENTISNAIHIDSKNNLVLSSNRTIATIGIENLIIADTEDALLIAQKGSGQRVKEVVQIIKKSALDLHHSHLTTHRPWGRYTQLGADERYKIKKIVVKPGKRLSLQKHFHRNEHWIVVSGTAKVTVAESEIVLCTNESTYIHSGVVHRLENPGKVDLVLIEVQVGEYLGEDDIVRMEDDHGRI